MGEERDGQEKGLVGRVWDYLKERVLPEAGDMLVHKAAQGSAEVAHALFSQSNAYVPYGEGQKALDVEGPQQSYTDMLRDASQREAPGPDRNTGIAR